MEQLETTIPFDGFYESLSSGALERDIEIELDELSEHLPDDFDFWGYTHKNRECEIDFCKGYVDLIGALTFKDLESPREYNFITDRIICTIPLDVVKTLIEKVDRDVLTIYLEGNFTSRDGFSSFYSNSLEDWEESFKTPENLDLNGVGALVACSYAFEDLLEEWRESYTCNGGGLLNYLHPECAKILDKARNEYDKELR